MHCLVLSVTNQCEWCDSGWWRWNPEFVDIVHDWWCWQGSYLKWALRTSSGPALMKKGTKFRFIEVVWNFALNLEKKNSSYIGHRDPTDDVFFFWWSRWPIHLRCSRLWSLMLAIFSFRQKIEVLHHDQWWDFVGILPLSWQTNTCHCLKAVPWGHVMGFGGRPIRFPSECKKFQVCSIQTLPNCEA